MPKDKEKEEPTWAQRLQAIEEEVGELYLMDSVPWVLGYSGGKDSTAVVQLVWNALAKLDPKKLKKKVHVISTDTLVENPVVAEWVTSSLKKIEKAAKESALPVVSHRLMPRVEDSFWTNLIGKGYPAPRHKFRWCTERMKIDPSNAFIHKIVKKNGQALLALGTRKAESSTRHAVMNRIRKQAEKYSLQERINPNLSLPGTNVYTPIEDWSNDEVWMYLMENKNPWGHDNKALLNMYQGASPDGECPLVVDTSTPSCGDSRFGCWVCTLVDKDKSMSAMIQNRDESDWMLPLLEFRNNYLDFRPADGSKEEQTDREKRDFRRINGSLTLHRERLVHGPYTQESRKELLFELLKAQRIVRELGQENKVEHAANLELITLQEIEEIRRIWIEEKHEIEDLVPSIYKDATGEDYPGKQIKENLLFSIDDLNLLSETCEGDELQYQTIRNLLDLERSYRTKARRSGLLDDLEKNIKRNFFEDEEDALQWALKKAEKNKIASSDAEEPIA
jgi:DNA sulfur modification protein DndC